MADRQPVEVRTGEGDPREATLAEYSAVTWATIRSALTISRIFSPSRTEVTDTVAEPFSSICRPETRVYAERQEMTPSKLKASVLCSYVPANRGQRR